MASRLAASAPSPARVALRITRAVLLAGTVLSAGASTTACFSKRPSSRAEDPVTSVNVRNQAFLDMNIYAVRGGQRVRLGTVTGNSTRVLRIPAYLLNGITPLRFVADPIGSQRTPTSDEIVVTPGDEVQLTIPPT